MPIPLNRRVGLAPNGFFLFVCGGANKDYELPRNIDEVYCNRTA